MRLLFLTERRNLDTESDVRWWIFRVDEDSQDAELQSILRAKDSQVLLDQELWDSLVGSSLVGDFNTIYKTSSIEQI